MKEPQLVIDKDIYDAIELVSEAEGGLHACQRFDKGRPCCMVGAMQYAGVITMSDSFTEVYADATKVLGEESVGRFDSAHRRLTSFTKKRLPWRQIAREANIIRGN